VTGLPTPTGDGLTVGFLLPHAGSAPTGVGSGMLSAAGFGPSCATNTSEGPDRLPPPVSGDMVGKLPSVSPARYVFNEESRAMLVPISFPDPPR
jgi:hypothetical protein